VFSYNLEEGWYIDQHQNQRRTADFLWLYILSSVTLLTAATIFAIPFLAMELHLAIVVVWAYRALGQLLRYKGVTIVSGAVVLMAYRAIVLSMWGPFAALGIGFMYYFLEDVFPAWPISRGVKLLKTPAVL
jgi:Derlin-2/3